MVGGVNKSASADLRGSESSASIVGSKPSMPESNTVTKELSISFFQSAHLKEKAERVGKYLLASVFAILPITVFAPAYIPAAALALVCIGLTFGIGKIVNKVNDHYNPRDEQGFKDANKWDKRADSCQKIAGYMAIVTFSPFIPLGLLIDKDFVKSKKI